MIRTEEVPVDAVVKKTLSSLSSRNINSFFAENNDEVNQRILSLIARNATVGIGDSTAARQLGIVEVLRESGRKVLNPFEMTSTEDRKRVQHEATVCDAFLTGTNALTQDGKLVNVDAVGNRVAGIVWGHPVSVVIVGRNKIVKDLDEAFRRVRTVIAPTHFQIRSVELRGRSRNTPCILTGECSDCRATDRGCNVFTIIEGKPARTDLNVIIVNQDIGLGFDPSWANERISKILENYKKFVWVPGREGS
jgi:hypothetical protein